MYGYIYLTENLVNYKCYIGQHRSNKFDESYKGSGKLLREAVDKYGWNNFITTIVEWCNSAEELDNRELYWINKTNAVNNECFYNLAYAAQNGGQNSVQDRICISKDDQCKYIFNEDLDEYLSLGWNLGDINRSGYNHPRSTKKFIEDHQEEIINDFKTYGTGYVCKKYNHGKPIIKFLKSVFTDEEYKKYKNIGYKCIKEKQEHPIDMSYFDLKKDYVEYGINYCEKKYHMGYYEIKDQINQWFSEEEQKQLKSKNLAKAQLERSSRHGSAGNL